MGVAAAPKPKPDERGTTPAEDIQREKEMNAFMAQTTRQSAAGSGHRATYRKQRGDMLLQELTWAR